MYVSVFYIKSSIISSFKTLLSCLLMASCWYQYWGSWYVTPIRICLLNKSKSSCKICLLSRFDYFRVFLVVFIKMWHILLGRIAVSMDPHNVFVELTCTMQSFVMLHYNKSKFLGTTWLLLILLTMKQLLDIQSKANEKCLFNIYVLSCTF